MGCGWLGLPLGKHLATQGYTIKGSTTRSSKLDELEKAGIHPFHMKLTPKPEGNWQGLFDTEILLVNLPPRNQNGVPDFHKSQLKEIIDLAQSTVEKVIFISSTAVYPANNEEVVETGASMNCLTRGGISLLEMEQLFAQNLSFVTTVLRFGGLYGPGRHPGNFLAGKKDLPGAENPVNMVHLDDCIGVITSIIEKDVWGEVFNVCSPSKESRQSFYLKAAKDLQVEPPTFSTMSSPYKRVNCEKLMQKTGYRFKH